jgi:hypothetical protein
VLVQWLNPVRTYFSKADHFNTKISGSQIEESSPLAPEMLSLFAPRWTNAGNSESVQSNVRCDRDQNFLVQLTWFFHLPPVLCSYLYLVMVALPIRQDKGDISYPTLMKTQSVTSKKNPINSHHMYLKLHLLTAVMWDMFRHPKDSQHWRQSPGCYASQRASKDDVPHHSSRQFFCYTSVLNSEQHFIYTWGS